MSILTEKLGKQFCLVTNASRVRCENPTACSANWNGTIRVVGPEVGSLLDDVVSTARVKECLELLMKNR